MSQIKSKWMWNKFMIIPGREWSQWLASSDLPVWPIWLLWRVWQPSCEWTWCWGMEEQPETPTKQHQCIILYISPSKLHPGFSFHHVCLILGQTKTCVFYSGAIVKNIIGIVHSSMYYCDRFLSRSSQDLFNALEAADVWKGQNSRSTGTEQDYTVL